MTKSLKKDYRTGTRLEKKNVKKNRAEYMYKIEKEQKQERVHAQ